MKRFQLYIVIVSCLSALIQIGCGGAKGDSATSADAQQSEAPGAMDLYRHYMAEAGMAQAEERKDDALENYLAAAAALDETGEPSAKRADAHFQAAEMAYQTYKKELAIEEYEKAVELYLRFAGNAQSKAAVAYTNMGVVWKELHDKAKARTCWQQALEVYKNAPVEGQNAAHIEKINQNIRDLDEGY